jgi:predicted transcriptional regulator
MSPLSRRELDAFEIIARMELLYQHREFTLDNIESSMKIDRQAIKDSLKFLMQMGYIREKIVLNIKDSSKSATKYLITPKGKKFAIEHRRRAYQKKEMMRRTEEYELEKQRTKKSNKRWAICCITGFFLIITIAIVVALNLG